ncbi:MAG: alanine--tRNA ligase, partial [Firmicutes bacterium]|nr:alanine--tRNA ligase [Bacillota bacterium]
VVLDRTPFYAEKGGQVADHGVLMGEGVSFTVDNVLVNKGGKYMHYGKVTKGEIKVGDTLVASYDEARRRAIRRAHSATHLLHAALVKTLGEHVHQAGSLVEPDRLRFDFTHFSAMASEELQTVESLVNQAILEGHVIDTQEMAIDEAKRRGATALFGEKYGNEVRVVSMGDVSVELCGGTHLDNTAKAGTFHILAEFSVASGVRRIEAVTGEASLTNLLTTEGKYHEIAGLLKARPDELIDRIRAEQAELRELRRQLEQLKAKESLSEVSGLLDSAQDVGGLRVLAVSRPNLDPGALRQLGDFLRDKEANIVGVLASVNEGKLSFLAVCGKGAVARGVKAGDIIRHVTAICGGKGGGKPDSAMGGGTELAKMDEALRAVPAFVAGVLGQ